MKKNKFVTSNFAEESLIREQKSHLEDTEIKRYWKRREEERLVQQKLLDITYRYR